MGNWIHQECHNNRENMRIMEKVLNYETLGWALKAMSDACFKAAEQQKKGEKVTERNASHDADVQSSLPFATIQSAVVRVDVREGWTYAQSVVDVTSVLLMVSVIQMSFGIL